MKILSIFLSVLLFCCSFTSCSVESEPEISINELKEASDVCVCISTFSRYEQEEKDGFVYKTVDVLHFEQWQIDALGKKITIIEKDTQYIEKENGYIVFLNKTNEDGVYELSYGKSGVIVGNELTPLDRRLKKDVEECFGGNIRGFEEWFKANYTSYNVSGKLKEDSTVETTKNASTFS